MHGGGGETGKEGKNSNVEWVYAWMWKGDFINKHQMVPRSCASGCSESVIVTRCETGAYRRGGPWLEGERVPKLVEWKREMNAER